MLHQCISSTDSQSYSLKPVLYVLLGETRPEVVGESRYRGSTITHLIEPVALSTYLYLLVGDDSYCLVLPPEDCHVQVSCGRKAKRQVGDLTAIASRQLMVTVQPLSLHIGVATLLPT